MSHHPHDSHEMAPPVSYWVTSLGHSYSVYGLPHYLFPGGLFPNGDAAGPAMDSSVLRAWSEVIALSGDRPCSSRDLIEGLFVQLEGLDPAADLLRARDFAATGDAPEDPAWVELGWDVLWPGRSLARDYLANTSGW
jgi:hypothetical protein